MAFDRYKEGYDISVDRNKERESTIQRRNMDKK